MTGFLQNLLRQARGENPVSLRNVSMIGNPEISGCPLFRLRIIYLFVLVRERVVLIHLLQGNLGKRL